MNTKFTTAQKLHYIVNNMCKNANFFIPVQTRNQTILETFSVSSLPHFQESHASNCLPRLITKQKI